MSQTRQKLKFEISVFALVFIALTFYYNCYQTMLSAYICVLIHEFAHCYGCFVMSVGVKKIKILPFGMNIELEDERSLNSDQELFIASMGPISNAVILILCYLFMMNCKTTDSLFFNNFVDSNVMMLLVNVLPVLPLDGGRILNAWLRDKWGSIKAYKTIKHFSVLVTIIIVVVAVIEFCLGYYDLSKLYILCVLIFEFKTNDKRIIQLTANEIMFSKNKIGRNRPVVMKEIAVTLQTPLYSIFSSFANNYFYVVNVVDENNRIICKFTETEIIDYILKSGNKIKFSDIITC